MTGKKKPRTGATGLLRIPCNGDDGSWGELSITAILRPGREHRKTTGAGGAITTPSPRRDDGWAVPACRGPEIRAGLRCDHVWIGFMAPRQVPAPRTIKAPVE